MPNKIYITLLFLAITIPPFINHQVYGNSNSTISQYEMIKNYQYDQRKKQSAKIVADYMYDRIKFYQEFDDRYARLYAIWTMYEALQNMDLDKE